MQGHQTGTTIGEGGWFELDCHNPNVVLIVNTEEQVTLRGN